MAITESSRHHLHQRLDEVLGPDDATTLMEHLPPVGWAEVATKRDLDHSDVLTKAYVDSSTQRLEAKIDGVEQRLEAKIDGVEQRLEAKIERGFRVQLGELIVAIGALLAIVVTVSHLF